MSNRKRIKSNSKSTIFGITLKTKKYKIMQAPGTEVGEGAWSETSVQKAENGRPVRKSKGAQRVKLPSKTVKTGL